MQPPEDYTLGKCIHAGARSEVYAAVRADGREVLLKQYMGADPLQAEARARREFDFLRRLEGPGIAAALDCFHAQGRPVLVLERAPGVSLSTWIAGPPPSAEAFLDIAVQLVEVFARVHDARLIHRDVSPANIVIDPATLRVHVIDFELARPLGTALPGQDERLGSSGLAGTLLYIAPEATGRMDRGVDSRSDLYSLGAALYHLLTGHPPFESDDALALIHAHIARTPIPPSERRPGVPGTLSRIVSKLLHKAPEDRYQTSHALHRDLLECRDQLRRSGTVQDDFPLGSADAPYRPVFSKRLYGREAEVAVLRQSYASAASGLPTVLLLAGAPGMGKSALVHELRTPLVQTGGYLALGKFDQYRRDVPFSGFAQAFASLAGQLLTESDARLAQWRSELCAGLGAIAGVLVALVPELGIVLGDVPPVPQLGPAETRARLGLAVQRFLQALARKQHPLVLCLDDLQWADTASRELLRELLLESRGGALLVLGAYRDNEIDGSHPFSVLVSDLEQSGVPLRTLALAPLGESACAQMLADALGRDPQQTRSLAVCVARKTGNTPLLIQQFIYHMYDVGLVHFEPGIGWNWDDTQLAAADIPDDAVALMTAKIARLPAAVAGALELASCAGDSFDLDTLAELTDRPRAELESALFALCDEGLIAPAPRGFRFVHDRIREAAQGLLSAQESARLHHQAARLLLERTPPESLGARAFEIADHFLLAELLDPAEQLRALEIHRLAGKSALLSGAPATASHYFDAARAQFRDAHWQSHLGLGFELFLESAASALQLHDFAKAHALLDAIEKQPLSRPLAAQLACQRVKVWVLMLPPLEAAPRVLDMQDKFGLRAPRSPSLPRMMLASLWTEWMLRGPLDERAFRPLRPGEHDGWLALLSLMTAGGGAVAAGAPTCFFLNTLWLLRLFRRRGYERNLPAALASYAAMRINLFRDLRGAERYGQAALDWARRIEDPGLEAKTRYILDAYVYSITRPRRSVLDPLRVTAEQLFEVGDLEFGGYALFLRGALQALAGEPLDLLERDLAALEERARGTGSTPHTLNRRALRLLRDPEASGAAIEGEIEAIGVELRGNLGSRFGPWSVWMTVLGLLGRFEEALVAALDCGDVIKGQLGMDVQFFRGIAAAALAGDPHHASRKRPLARILQQCSRALDGWARSCPDFEHMARGLRAERARLRGHTREALALYAQAADRALAQGYRHHCALFHERRADLLASLRRATEAASALSRAIALYEEWGARGKAAALRSSGEHRP